MIAFVDGVVSEVKETSVVLQAGAFGLEVFAPKPTLMNCKVGISLRLHTYLVVKEDLLALYGFHDNDMRKLFTYLIGVSGGWTKASPSYAFLTTKHNFSRSYFKK